MRRVVVTGMGMVTPLGDGVDTNWRRLMAAESGIRCDPGLRHHRSRDQDRGRGAAGRQGQRPFQRRQLHCAQGPAQDRQVHRSSASPPREQAVEDSGWKPSRRGKPQPHRRDDRLGHRRPADDLRDLDLVLKERGPRRVSPFFIPSALINLASGQVSIKYGFKGPNHSVVTACATGAHAHRRRRAPDPARATPTSWWRAAPRPRSAASASPASTPARRCRPTSTTRRPRRRGRGTSGATASSWARARASSCWRSTSTPRSAAPRSTPRSSATACRATPITSPRRPRTATAPSAP